jgi:hypothetical protein
LKHHDFPSICFENAWISLQNVLKIMDFFQDLARARLTAKVVPPNAHAGLVRLVLRASAGVNFA